MPLLDTHIFVRRLCWPLCSFRIILLKIFSCTLTTSSYRTISVANILCLIWSNYYLLCLLIMLWMSCKSVIILSLLGSFTVIHITLLKSSYKPKGVKGDSWEFVLDVGIEQGGWFGGGGWRRWLQEGGCRRIKYEIASMEHVEYNTTIGLSVTN